MHGLVNRSPVFCGTLSLAATQCSLPSSPGRNAGPILFMRPTISKGSIIFIGHGTH